MGSMVLAVSMVAMPIIWHESSKHLAMADDHYPADQPGATADQRKMSPADRALTQAIRKAIHHDNRLSNFGRNIKIFTQNGKVVLRGPVRSDEEKVNLEAKATNLAGQGNVSNQLKVTPLK
jgi:osmotically-inducible protein OsmY